MSLKSNSLKFILALLVGINLVACNKKGSNSGEIYYGEKKCTPTESWTIDAYDMDPKKYPQKGKSMISVYECSKINQNNEKSSPLLIALSLASLIFVVCSIFLGIEKSMNLSSPKKKKIPLVNRILDLESSIKTLKQEIGTWITVENRFNELQARLKKLEQDHNKISISPAMPSSYYSERSITPVYQLQPIYTPDPFQVAIDAFNRLDKSFFGQKERRLLTLDPSTRNGETDLSGSRIVLFESASNDSEAEFFALQINQQHFLFPNLLSPYYHQLHWLYDNPDIFPFSGSEGSVKLQQPAQIEYRSDQWHLIQPGSCTLT